MLEESASASKNKIEDSFKKNLFSMLNRTKAHLKREKKDLKIWK